jgi:spore maturation protein CgeB
MRILIAGHAYEDSFADNVRCALEEMGHEVRTLGNASYSRYNAEFRFYARAVMERVGHRAFELDAVRLIRIAKTFRPDIVLTLTREYPHDVLADLDSISKPAKILWWGDSPANARRYGMIEPLWDLVFIKDAVAVEKTRIVRRDVYLLHEAMNPKWHRPLSPQQTDRLVVAGNWYGFRQALVKRLLDDGVGIDLYGSKPPAWGLPEIRAQHLRRYIVCEEKSRIFGGALACLNSFQYAEGDSLNCRAFEIAGAGGLQLIEYRPAISQCFEPGQELLVFRTYEELLALIERARKDPRAMRRIREAGARRALTEHTYRHRMEVILGHL